MILFLDLDGVLHPDEAYLVHGRSVLRAEGELFMWAPLLIFHCEALLGLRTTHGSTGAVAARTEGLFVAKTAHDEALGAH